MNNTVKKYFKFNLIVMRLLGYYSPQRIKSIYKFYSFAVFIFCTLPVPILAAIHLFIGENVDLNEIGDSSFVIFEVGCFSLKAVPFIFSDDEVRKVIYMLELPIFNKNDPKAQEFLKKGAQITRRNTWLFCLFCSLSAGSWALSPIATNHKYPIEIWLPNEIISDDVLFYIFLYLFIALGAANAAIANGVIDPLVAGMACFASYQVKILKHNLEHLGEIHKKDFGNLKAVNSSTEIFRKIKECIRHHSAIISFTQYFEDTFSSVVFAQFIASAVVICVAVLQLSLVEPFSYTFFAMMFFLITMLWEVFLYCYFGASLFEESNSLATAIYMGNWYDYDMKAKKGLIILMERSKRPITVTAGKILELSLGTFTMILRRAYSLLAVLNSYEVQI